MSALATSDPKIYAQVCEAAPGSSYHQLSYLDLLSAVLHLPALGYLTPHGYPNIVGDRCKQSNLLRTLHDEYLPLNVRSNGCSPITRIRVSYTGIAPLFVTTYSGDLAIENTPREVCRHFPLCGAGRVVAKCVRIICNHLFRRSCDRKYSQGSVQTLPLVWSRKGC